MDAVIVIAGLGLMVWLLARAGVFRAFGRSAPARKVDTSTRAIGGLPDLPAAMGFRPVFRYELLPALRALGEVPPEGEPDGLDDLAGCAAGTAGRRRVILFARPSENGTGGPVTGAVTTIAADLPRVEIVPAGLPAPERADGAPDLELGVEEFDRAYKVHCVDADAARALIDGSMRQFLLSIVRPWTFSAGGGFVIVRATDLDATGIDRVLEALGRFADHVPQEVRLRYPQAATRFDDLDASD